MQDIFAIRCSQCGNPVEFDIVSQNYHCSACGFDMPAAEVTQAVRKRSEDFSIGQNIKLSKAKNAQNVFSCHGCGANIFMSDKDFVSSCGFCGTSVTKSDFKGASFPQGIIPFYITKDEAVDIFRKWALKNMDVPGVRIALMSIDNLDGYYMPFQMVRGPLRMKLGAYNKGFACGGYLDGIFVSQCSRVDNVVLDNAEPFDVSDLMEFDFSFVAGHKALLPDESQDGFFKNLRDEIIGVYNEEVTSQLGTKQIYYSDFDSDKVSDLIFNTVYLPIYFLKVTDNFAVVVNGQTGRIAMGGTAKVVKSKYGFLKRGQNNSLRKVMHQFPEYKPAKPLFYEGNLPGYYSRSFLDVDGLLSVLENVLYNPASLILFIIFFFKVVINHNSDFMYMLIFMLIGLVVGLFQYYQSGLKSLHFVPVVAKYRNGGSNGDKEIYKGQFNERKFKIAKCVLIPLLIFAIVLSVRCFFFGLTHVSVSKYTDPYRYYYIEGHKAQYKEIKYDYDVNDYYIGFYAKPLESGWVNKSSSLSRSVVVQFNEVNGSQKSFSTTVGRNVKVKPYYLVVRKINSDDLDNQGYLVLHNFDVMPFGFVKEKYRVIKPSSSMKSSKGKSVFSICDESDTSATYYLNLYKRYYGTE